MSDGPRLRQLWTSALSNAEAQFRSLLVSSGSSAWKRVPLPVQPLRRDTVQNISSNANGKGRLPMDGVVMHRRQAKRGDIMRLVLDVPLEDSVADLDKWRAVLSTPEIRVDWDPAVEGSSLVEMFDWNTRITRTNYALGWPANPRDAVTISKTFHDATTLIDISTSLPRSYDEPAYLRPAPPYVRSHVHLFAWCIQSVPAQTSNGESTTPSSSDNRLRITCFWQHDLKAVWALSSALPQQLPTTVQSLLRVVQKRGHRLPLLCAYGTGVTLERIAYEVGREALNVEYAIVHEDEDEGSAHAVKALEEVNALKEKKRLERRLEFILPENIGWDVQISTRASSDIIAALPWNVTANRTSTSADVGHTIFRVHHSSLPDTQSILKVKMVIEVSGSASGLRVNGLPHSIIDVELRDPTSFTLSRQMLQDTSSVSGLSFHSLSTGESSGDVSASSTRRGLSHRGGMVRSPAAEKAILTRVKRNYIYFSSLLQEPEAKWKRNSEARGVTITQLDSIDPTLVVYRAEAVFVGVGLWDLYSTIASPGARVYWDKGHEDADLMEDVNELTELWHWTTKPNWPANARDAVLLKTVYKSPTTVHVFSFSTDDTQLFSSIPPTDPNIIRTQVDLQGWAIETLSPTTTLLTLLEQSDPRGWAGKSSIPQQMVNAVAGVGEYAIRCGGPPFNTRLAGARSLSTRYDHEKGSFKLEYEGCEARRSGTGSIDFASNGNRNSSIDIIDQPSSLSSPDLPPSPVTGTGSAPLPYIECELRCDLDAWASSLDIVIDPPPQAVSSLRRHRLSSGGGGLWLTIGHDAVFAGDDRLMVTVRKGTAKEKGSVVVNGAKIKVDVEELPESEVKALTKMKRVKPVRIPLDQPPVLGVIRRRREEWNDDSDNDNGTKGGETATTGVMQWAASTPRFSSPLAQFWTRAVEQTTATTSAAVNAATMSLGAGVVRDLPISSSRPPMAYALSALAFLRDLHLAPSLDGWTLVTDKGFPVHRKLFPKISTAIPVHKGEKVIEGVSAEEVAHIVNNYDSRAAWDDRFDSAVTLQEFGTGCHTAFIVSKGGFPFRDRGFYIASISGRLVRPSDPSGAMRQHNGAVSPHSQSTTIFCASASFSPSSVDSFDTAKYNPHGLPIGRVMIQGWILETLDPYTTENYAIPSTRCTHVASVDYAGSVPVAFNSLLNASLPRVLLAVDQHTNASCALPAMRLPSSEFALVLDDSSRSVGDFQPTDTAWKIEMVDETRLLVSKRYHPSTKKFRGTILISLNASAPDVMTPRPSTSAVIPLPDVPVSPERSATPFSSPATSPASTIRSRRVSTVGTTIRPSRSMSRDGVHAVVSSSPLRNGDFHSGDTIPVDFLVGELIIDSKLYPDGYEVRFASHRHNPKNPRQPLAISPILATSSELPITCTCHVLPSTPLHSSGLNIDSPPRHLLRFTLPTAQYEVLPNDPLLLQPLTRPAWLTDLWANGAVVEIVVFPAAGGALQGKGLVIVNGSALDVMNEKESIRLLRRELEDERLGRMPILSTIPSVAGAETIPDALIEPIAVATTLYNSARVADQPTTTGTTSKSTEEKTELDREATPEGHSETTVNDSLRTSSEDAEAAIMPSSGLLRFLNGYPNAIFRRGSQALDFSTKPASSVHGSPAPSHSSSSIPSLAVKAEIKDKRLYPLSTVLVIGLISFLLGSLLRSLLTPADFIYMSRDMSELEDGHDRWREIKRLIEFKYAVGGWDFLIGIVKRH